MNSNITRILQHKATLPTVVGIVGFASGYLLGKRNGDVFEIVHAEINESYEAEDVVEDTQLEEVETLIEQEGYVDAGVYIPEEDGPRITVNYNHISTAETPAVANIFANNGSDWNLDEELTSRTGSAPYVIHVDEFTANEHGCTQTTVTYYTDDDVMTDALDEPIYDHKSKFGELKFGHGSNSDSLVYIRNEEDMMEFEVIRFEGSYLVEIGGLEIEHEYDEQTLKHSAVLKFRDN